MKEQNDIDLRVSVQKEFIKEAIKEAMSHQGSLYREGVKEGIKEWMTEGINAVGRWTLKAALIVAFAGLVYFVLMLSGWKGPGK